MIKSFCIVAIVLLAVSRLFGQANTVAGLPPGVGLAASSGVLSGNPTTFGVYQFTIQVQDGETPPQTASKQFTLTIAPCPLQITSVTPLPPGQVGLAYSQQITATCGDGNYTWTVTTTSSAQP